RRDAPARGQLCHTERGESRHDGAALIGATDAEPRARFDAEAGNVDVAEKDVPARRTEIPSKNGEQRALARAIRTDHRMNFAGVQLEVDGIDCDQAAKTLSHLLRAQERFTHGATAAIAAWRHARRRERRRAARPARPRR